MMEWYGLWIAGGIAWLLCVGELLVARSTVEIW